MSDNHAPVLFQECMDALAIRPDGVYIDGTFGRGGHSAGILAQLGEQGRLIAFDQDTQAIAYGQQRFEGDARIRFVHANFARMAEYVDTLVDGILLDLGVSSPQLDNAERGFSFMQSGPLDMRMDTQNGVTLATKLANVSVDELTHVLKVYGEEKFARRIAVAIVEAMASERGIVDTLALAQVIADAQPVKDKYKHPATRAFQALRIWVNDEMGVLRNVLDSAVNQLKPGGRLAVISFHSLEDRMVKQYFRDLSRGRYDDALRQVVSEPRMKSLGKRFPSLEETEQNPRARSAILRVVESL
ncbi:MAG: 16S rRNA (cytosine(1402)-N(4))-methyltransferase RsmH [Thiotrichales bacterium]|jgi:16S rRNA (cytosine1402-N4)-methyltransferase|nr:16S rRNA (cytosine(1402)-N(4))-methyltransferase RsmH [Thiotrichales bacterium]